MTTTVMTVNSPSEYTNQKFLVGLRNKAINNARRAGGWLRQMSDRTGLSRVTSFARRYLVRAYNFGKAILNAAGAVPLGILLLTSRTGQKMIKSTAKFLWGVWSWAGNKVLGAFDWLFRRFGAPGRRFADWTADVRSNVSAFLTNNARKAAKFITPYTSPDRIYMRAGKGVSYVIVAANLIGRFVPGVWKIPAYLFAAVFGLLSIPELRTSALINRMVGAFEDQAQSAARRTVAEQMEAMIATHGPQMDTWITQAKNDYAIKQGVYNYLDGVDDPFKGLSGNQRKKAEQWLRNFKGDLAELEKTGKIVAGNLDYEVAHDGHIISVSPAPVLQTV